jgi:hypothetical protein
MPGRSRAEFLVLTWSDIPGFELGVLLVVLVFLVLTFDV